MNTRYIQRTLSVALSALLLTAPALASDRGVNSGDRGPATRTELGPSPGTPNVRAGAAYAGMEQFTEADLRAAGAELTPQAEGVDPLHPELAEMIEASPETIIGWDSRMRFYTTRYPNRAIVYIQYNNSHLCTGFMVSRNTVVTSGHCVHTGGANGNWRTPRLFQVFPGRNGVNSPYGSCGVTRLHSVVGWTRDGNHRFDYGALRLDCNIGNIVGWFGVYSPNDNMLTNAATRVIGYPGDKAQQQWGSSDRVRRVEPRMVCYRDDTIGGNSGGPVWNDRNNGLFSSGAWAYGIHGYGIGGSVCGGANNQFNGGVRTVGPVVNRIIDWIQRP